MPHRKTAKKIGSLFWTEADIVEMKRFETQKDFRIVCDATQNGLRALLEQLRTEGWRPVSIASHFLNASEQKYFTNELEKLVFVWWG